MPPRAHNSRPAILYRLYDAAGALLYVGVTARGFRRMGDHMHERDWWSEVRRVDLEHHATTSDAIEREGTVIRTEAPRYNQLHAIRPRAQHQGGPTHRLLTVPQVAERLQVSEESVRRWLRAKRLRGVMPGGTRMGWRISEQEVERFLAAASGATEGGPGST